MTALVRQAHAASAEERPISRRGERPTEFADRLGGWYLRHQTNEHRKAHGLYLTPVAVADFMAQRLSVSGKHLRVLDPAAGSGLLCCAAVEALARVNAKPNSIELVAYEVDRALANVLSVALGYLADCVAAQGVKVTFRIEARDFLATHGDALRSSAPILPSEGNTTGTFDAVIANPPYFKLSRADPRALAAAEIVHGQPNIYALFMALAGTLLRQGGSFVSITPRSFASGSYFRKFRTVFFELIRPAHVHVFGSRKDAFRRDDVLQENVILVGERASKWPSAKPSAKLTVSQSRGVDDLNKADIWKLRAIAALDLRSTNKVLKLPASEEDENALRAVESWPSSLQALGLRISTGPVVPFRARTRLGATGDVPATHAPLLWMNHVRPLRTTWPLSGPKAEFIRAEDAGTLLVRNRNYVLLRRFSAKEEPRRLVAAPYLARNFPGPAVGFENHLNYIHRPDGELMDDEVWGLAALYNTRLLDTYFRIVNGNTQVNATELRAMPLPAHAAIIDLGRRVRTSSDPLHAADEYAAHMTAKNYRMEQPIGVG